MSDAAAHLATAERSRAAGDLYEAALHQRRAIALLRNSEPLALGQALRQLAEMLVESGEVAAAAAPLDEVLTLYRDTPGVAPLERIAALRCAAWQAGASDDRDTAHAFWAEVYVGYEALGDAAGMAEAQTRIEALQG